MYINKFRSVYIHINAVLIFILIYIYIKQWLGRKNPNIEILGLRLVSF